jgi:hypothetical protein
MLNLFTEVEERHWSTFFSEFFGFPLRIINPPLFHNHTLQTLKECDNPDEAAQYQIFGHSSL